MLSYMVVYGGEMALNGITKLSSLMITSIKNTQYPEDVHQIIEKMDLHATLKVVNMLESDLERVKLSSTGKVALDNLHEVLVNLQSKLEKLEKNVQEYNNRSYIYYFSRLDVRNQLSDIEMYVSKLEGRLKLLMDILKLGTVQY